MNPFRLIEKKDNKRLTWKNGLGHTDEIAIYPPSAELKKGDFLWRISSARIEQASPFSLFPNHDRFLVVLTGGGLRLTHCFVEGEEEEQVDIPLLTPYEFPGDVPSRCELRAGPITDLSVFIRKGEVESQVDTRSFDEGDEFEWLPAGRWNFVVVVSGLFESGESTLTPGDTLSLELQSPATHPVILKASDGPGTLVMVSLSG